MTNRLDFSIVRICSNEDESSVGVGTLVGKRHVLTCAHVVADALGKPDLANGTQIPENPIRVQLPHIGGRPFFMASVRVWKRCQDNIKLIPEDGEDIAVLELDSSSPAEAELIKFADSSEISGHRYQAFGYPLSHNVAGTWSHGIISRRITNQRIQLEGIGSQGISIQKGFSGSPVFDEQLGQVVGIVIAADESKELKLSFMIPTDILRKAWTDLPIVGASPEDYHSLRNLLQVERWRDANQKTLELMSKVVRRENEGWLSEKDLESFPCEELKEIDRLWSESSGRKFGFSTQRKIWEKCDRPMSSAPWSLWRFTGSWDRFGDCVGWRRDGHWIDYDDLTFNLESAREGELPVLWNDEKLWDDAKRGANFFWNKLQPLLRTYLPELTVSLEEMSPKALKALQDELQSLGVFPPTLKKEYLPVGAHLGGGYYWCVGSPFENGRGSYLFSRLMACER